MIKIDKKEWARHVFTHDVKVYHVANNLTESWNNWLNECRDKPVLTLMEFIRKKGYEKLVQKAFRCKKMEWEVTSNCEKKVECFQARMKIRKGACG